MSDQETLNRAFAQAVTVLVSMPNRAGKSALHRQIEQTEIAVKADKLVKNNDRIILNKDTMLYTPTYAPYTPNDQHNPWFEPIESRYGIIVDEAESLRAVFDKNMKASLIK